MDYHRPLTASKDNPKVHIALVLKPGVSSTNGQFSKSPLLINPGGPGGSGTTFALAAAGALQLIIDPDQDIIGFDPRGVGATTPRADCFSYPADGASPGTGYLDEDYITGSFNRLMWQLSAQNIGNVNSSEDAFRNLHARARTISNLCQEKDNLHGNDSILRYVHTPSVAHDMISIVDAWDEWMDTKEPSCEKQVQSAGEVPSTTTTKGKLLYWGFSYGTLLGATFASMFPDRVGRIVLDGVIDADHYVQPIWDESIEDADAVFNSFSRYCFEAGDKCQYYRASDTSADSIAHRFNKIVTNIKEHPLSVVNPRTKIPFVITHGLIRLILFAALYAPNTMFPVVATIADWLENNNIEYLREIVTTPQMPLACNTQAPAYSFTNEAQAAIMCSDKRYGLNDTVPELERIYEQMANTSIFADVWLTIMLECQAWSVKAIDPPRRWDDHPGHIHKDKPINTSFPLLFISNRYDPVTPLSSGLKMARKFVGAGLVEQLSEGHCSLAATSVCTIKTLRAYFGQGKVPPVPTEDEWLRCEADDWPWHSFGEVRVLSGGNARIEMAVGALKQVQEAFGKVDLFGLSLPVDVSGLEEFRSR